MDSLFGKIVAGVLVLYMFAYLAPAALNALFNVTISDPVVAALLPIVGLVFVIGFVWAIYKGWIGKVK